MRASATTSHSSPHSLFFCHYPARSLPFFKLNKANPYISYYFDRFYGLVLLYYRYVIFVKYVLQFYLYIKMSTLNSTFFHVFIVLPFCTIRSLFYCIFSLLGSAIVRLPLLPASHAPYFRSYASCFTSSSNSSPAE